MRQWLRGALAAGSAGYFAERAASFQRLGTGTKPEHCSSQPAPGHGGRRVLGATADRGHAGLGQLCLVGGLRDAAAGAIPGFGHRPYLRQAGRLGQFHLHRPGEGQRRG